MCKYAFVCVENCIKTEGFWQQFSLSSRNTDDSSLYYYVFFYTEH